VPSSRLLTLAAGILDLLIAPAGKVMPPNQSDICPSRSTYTHTQYNDMHSVTNS
jgi:hypothetical protein